MVYQRKLEHLPGFAITGTEPAHLTVLVTVVGSRASELVPAIERLGGRAPVVSEGMVTAELPEVLETIEFVLGAVEALPDRRGGVHMGKVTANDDAVGGHPGRVTVALAGLAEPGETLITGGVIVEMGDGGFERFKTGSMGAADLDASSYAVYSIVRRPPPP
ncbi:MAG: hypothetical protein ABI572_06370 [Actinomycetota bacterium]